MGLEVHLGFSGGKDSQVCYDLCKRAGIPFKAFFNHAFESNITLRFIKENYPDVIWRRDYKLGFIQIYGKPQIHPSYCTNSLLLQGL